MKIKHRLCGFIGHKSIAMTAYVDNRPAHVQLKCTNCGFKTKWFDIRPSLDEIRGKL